MNKFYINQANGREEIAFELIELDRDGNITSVYTHTYNDKSKILNSLDLDTIIYTDEVSTECFKISDIFKCDYVKVEMEYSRDRNHDFEINKSKYKCYFVVDEAMYSMQIIPATLSYDVNKHSFIIRNLYQPDNDDLISAKYVYENEDTCLKYNKVKTTDLAGNVTYKGGEALLLEFTDEQKNILDDLVKLINKCKDMGIGFRHSDYDYLSAYRMDIHDDMYDEIVMSYNAEMKEGDVDMTDYANPYHVMCMDDFDPCNSAELILRRKKDEKDI